MNSGEDEENRLVISLEPGSIDALARDSTKTRERHVY